MMLEEGSNTDVVQTYRVVSNYAQLKKEVKSLIFVLCATKKLLKPYLKDGI